MPKIVFPRREEENWKGGIGFFFKLHGELKNKGKKGRT